jgi:alkanesulfonate monooxygenase SsuD/methylene tetrahydromethanopterin reductase-like flavin-dependent oxidoreductase (luciferase family)
LFGIGNGWNQDEMENHGTVFASRRKLVRERIEAMKAIWTQTKAEYHGEFVNFDPMMTWPKPVQKPHPPILVGGAFPYAARRAVRYGDGWIPTVGRPGLADETLALLPKFRDMLKEAGRDPASCPVSFSSLPGDLDTLKRCRDAGIVRVNVALQAATEQEALPILDKWAAFITQV